MSKILANQIANYGDNNPIEVKEGINIPAGKPLQADGVSGASGQVLSSTGTTVEWTTPFDGDYNSLANLPTIPAAQVRADWLAVGTVAEILNKPVVPAQPSVTDSAPSGGGSLTYNPANGEFNFTPPDLTGYALTSDVANSDNWDAAYNWGNHATQGYLTAETDPQFQTWFNNNGASGISTTTINQWNTAYGWGDHATEGYLTFESDTLQSVSGRNNTTTVSIAVGGLELGTLTQLANAFGTSNTLTFGGDMTMFHMQDGVHGTSNRIVVDEHNLVIGTKGESPDNYYNEIITVDVGNDLGSTGNTAYVKLGFGNVGTRLETTAAGVSITGNLSVSGTTDLDIEDLNNVDIGGGLTDQQVLKWDAATTSWKPANDLVGGASGIELADLSVSQNAPGSASLLYNNSNGVFTYTPPDLTDFIGDTDFGAAGLMTTDGSGNYSITVNASANWNTAYGWGDHSTQGYLTAETDPVFSAHVASGILQQNINNWNTAYAWGNHATQGYATTTDLNTAVANSANWDTAYGWGDHSQAGYLTAEADTLDTVLSRGASTTRDITTTGKLYYSNNFADLTALSAVSATTYHGMFAHVHAEAHGYFAHAGGWIQLLDTGSSIGELADVDLSTAPTTGQVLKWNGSNWVADDDDSGTVVANATISDTAPGSSSNGDLWWESDTGRLKIRYQDTDSIQWVDASPPLADATSIGGSGTVAMLASLIPDVNDAYDLGNAEYKIRDIYEANPSDARLKTDVVDYTGGLAFVESLRVVDFTWKDDVDVKAGKRETGLIAQEVKEALDASNYNSWRLHTDGDLQGVDKKQLIPALVAAIQELSARVKELENK